MNNMKTQKFNYQTHLPRDFVALCLNTKSKTLNAQTIATLQLKSPPFGGLRG